MHLSKFDEQLNCENLDCVGRVEIGQAGYLLNHPRTLVAYIANNMWVEGSSLITVHSICFHCRIILMCNCIFAGDVLSRRHFQDKDNGMIRG